MAKLTRFSLPKSPLLLATFATCASLALAPACSDDGPTADSESSATGTGDGDGDGGTDTDTATDSAEAGSDSNTTVGDGDGDDPATSGDGDGDTSGDGDGDTSGDGDGDTSGDGDGDDPTSGDGDGDDPTTGDGDGDDPTTGDGDGDPPPPDDDMDDDGIPDPDDPFPNDADLPGQATANLVYAHTSSRLFTMDPFNYDIAEVGQFTFDQSSGSVTDIAIDRWGVLYAVTFNDIFVCNPETAACYYLGDLPSSFNGLTMVPPGTIDDLDDTLIGIANDGRWFVVTIQNQLAQLNQIGQYGNGMSSSGDAFSILGTGTFGSVNKPNENSGDAIVESDPTTGMVLDELTIATGYVNLWGMAGWQGTIFGFNSGGEVIEIDPNGGNVVEVADTPHSWWGAGVYSVLPQ